MTTTTTICSEELVVGEDEPELVKVTKRQETDVMSDSAESFESATETVTTSSDEELLAEGMRLCMDDQILAGVRLFRKIKNSSLFMQEHMDFIKKAEIMEKLREDLLAPPSDGWTKQGESHGNRDFICYYKIEEGGKLKCRIESVIEASLYVPFLAVMNETDLYDTWFPRWSFPFRMGMRSSRKLKQAGRVEQVVQLALDLPYPLNSREILFWGFAEEDTTFDRTVGAKLLSVDETFPGGCVPPADKGVVRVDFESDFLFRPCPDDHDALKHSKAKYPQGERLILLTFVFSCDPKIAFVPHFFMNFCTRSAMGTIWNMILRISEEVKDGKRAAHANLIASKREELYDWVEERAALITGMKGTLKNACAVDQVEC